MLVAAAETKVKSRRGYLTLALTVWGLVVILGPFVAVFAVQYAANSTSGGSLFWFAVLIGIPAVIVSVLTGLASGLGAYISRRLSVSETHAGVEPSPWIPSSVGAGLGAMVVGALPLGYLYSLFPVGPPASVKIALCVALLFILFAGFAALWVRRAQHEVPLLDGVE